MGGVDDTTDEKECACLNLLQSMCNQSSLSGLDMSILVVVLVRSSATAVRSMVFLPYSECEALLSQVSMSSRGSTLLGSEAFEKQKQIMKSRP